MASVDKPFGNAAVGVDAAVAQKRPVAAHVFERPRSHSTTRISSPVASASAITLPNGSQTKRSAPELESARRRVPECRLSWPTRLTAAT